MAALAFSNPVLLRLSRNLQSDTFERVQQNKDASGLHNRAKLILEIEAFMRYDASGGSTSNWVKNLCVLFSMRIPYHTKPRFLHVLKPKSADGQSDEWQGRMRVMFKKFDEISLQQLPKIDANVKQLTNSQGVLQKETHAQMAEVQQQTKDQIGTPLIDTRLHSWFGFVQQDPPSHLPMSSTTYHCAGLYRRYRGEG